MNFEFATAARIVFGPGKIALLGQIVAEHGRSALIVTGRTPQRAEGAVTSIRVAGLGIGLFSIPREPDVEIVSRGAALAREQGVDVVVGFGGGSAMDGAKAIAALATNPGEPLDYLEIVGKGLPLTRPGLPFIAVPTTAGTGSEVTRNAVLSVPAHRAKVSLRSPGMLAKVALVDPELTHGLPARITAETGMDALTQLIEPYVCNRANPLTDAICLEGIKLCGRSLRVVFHEPHNATARKEMALASLFGGLALANSGLGAVHGFAAAIGGLCGIPHGAICAALLPHVCRANLRAAKRLNLAEVIRRYEEIARILCGDEVSAAEGCDWLERLAVELSANSLSAAAIPREMFPEIIERAQKASSMKANPVELTATDLDDILRKGL